MSQNPTPTAGPDRSSWYTIKQQRVRYANFWVKKDGILERPGPSWTSPELTRLRGERTEPWNVENVRFSGKGLEAFQYADIYLHRNNKRGQKALIEDELSWSVLFKPKSSKNICVREMDVISNQNRKQTSTFIELCFKYEGLPESKNSTRFKEDAAMDDAGDVEAEEGEEGETVEQGEEVENAEAEGEEAEDEPAKEVDMEEEEEMVEDDELPTPDQFDLAKLFAEPNDFKKLEVRIAFMRSPAKRMPWKWHWPAVLNFVRGMAEYTPQLKKAEMDYQFSVPLDEWMSKFGNKRSQRFISERQEDGTTKWTMRGRQQQLPLRPSTAVPAFGTQPPHQSPASVRPIPTPSPTSSEPSKDPTRRTLEEIEAEEEEIDREEERLRERYRVDQERLAARRRALREERRQISNG